MKKIWDYISKIIYAFAGCFTRDAAFGWFVIVIVGLLVREDALGVTSIIRSLALDPTGYNALIHFFHSTAWTLTRISSKWADIVINSGSIYEFDGKPVLIGDGVKVSKEGVRMPCVKRQHQESGDSSKPEYIQGHLFGGLGVLVGNTTKKFCLPLSMTIQDGCKPILQWIKSEYAKDSHVTRLVREGCRTAAEVNRQCFLLMDRYFLTVPALLAIKEESVRCGRSLITLITKAKSNATAFYPPGEYSGIGRRPVRGKEVKLSDFFSSKEAEFKTVELNIYNKKEIVRYLLLDLLWGRKLYQKLRFVLSVIDGSKCILVCSDLSVEPERIIELYSLRFKIESCFRAMKQSIRGFGYHFWTKHIRPLKESVTAAVTVENLAKVTDAAARAKIIEAYNAIEGFVMFSCIAMGILQVVSLRYSRVISGRWLRTHSSAINSEETVRQYLCKTLQTVYSTTLGQYIRDKLLHNDVGVKRTA
jgi:hypothetical protein